MIRTKTHKSEKIRRIKKKKRWIRERGRDGEREIKREKNRKKERK